MIENLFTDPGKKIKNIAQWSFVLGVVACIILAFVYGFEETYHYVYSYSYSETEFYAGYFFGFLIGGPLFFYLESLIMYAFGELVESTKYAKISSEKPSAPTPTPVIPKPVISDELPDL